MKKSLHINLRAYFGRALNPSTVGLREPEVLIRHSKQKHYKKDSDWAITQEFDGRYGYLYCHEISVEQEKTMPIKIKKNDLHVLYLIQGQEIELYAKNKKDTKIVLSAKRARYFYLPTGRYYLVLPKGRSLLFGFYFDGKIFRRNYELQFDFLLPLLHAQRQQLSAPVASIDFKVAERTHAYIEQLCDELTDVDLSNESTILTHYIALIKLSKEKVFDEYKIESADKNLATKAHKLLVQKVQHLGQEYRVHELAQLLDRNVDYLNKIHKIYYGCSLSELKDTTLLAIAKKLLATSPSISSCAYACGYSSVSAFTRFFQKQTGKTPSEFLNYTKKMR
ncbi:AraC family transcriptional regulator [Sphingobacterium sp. UT-1RO-CII-1]|uniref:helix-turn-helix domain-containing protein n=1 Tax=Sphingobacterium sp. UT-1RO-CII-1 TaxID=2995225 RepID=UPI00227C7E42|nr:AraC family transcriptional regulator [Sphingobacterium sp. UT-1RO-CII-1]MCY4779357.1 AraC family transcriptional regulator [Sphingobacterium sp. UT-1RO-CII-1]